ncbi:glycosyltransferase family 2 protein [Chryseobacterium sp. S-02]|uniref:glycosyltransferase family 2 protein n=1 Tax=Chryseobacterium sp. S-02 TaxID=3404064 RepID=UPI003CF122BC
MKPLLSIAIATKNRQAYCVSAVESILSLNNYSIQVIVQDNSDDKNLELLLEKYLDDSRLIYNYTAPPFSSIDNFNAAIELATGEYVCLIGDDDGINPEIIDATLWAKENDVDALTGSLSANYTWENTGAPGTFFTKNVGSNLSVLQFSARVYQVNLEDSLKKLMANGCTNYSEFDFPKLYHGIIRKSILEKIKEDTGDYMKGLSPDIYSAIALSCYVNKLIVIDYPLTIPGVCGQSTTVSEGQVKKHSKKIEDAPHFRDRGDYIWSKEVPRIYCVQTIWADSGFAALREMERTDLIQLFDQYMLFANIIYADKSLKNMVYKHIADLNPTKKITLRDRIKLNQAFLKGPIFKFITKRAIGRLKIILKISKFKNINNLPTINEAMLALTHYLKEEYQKPVHYYLNRYLPK